jgi:RNA polymerase sigma-70 factor, ECF subfamily
MDMSSDRKTDEFLALYRDCERRIYAYLMAMLGNPDDAEEVLQETLLTLWQNFSDFQPGTNFYAWAKQTAQNRVFIRRRRRQREKVPLDEASLAAIERVCLQQDDRLAGYLRFLDECVAKLSESDRGLVQARFQSQQTIKSVAEQLQRPTDTVYKALTRIYRWLAQCVERAASVEERS